MNEVILNVSDWNYEDKLYKLSKTLLDEFGKRVCENGVESALDWLMPQVDHTNDLADASKLVKCVDHCVDHTLDVYFFDYLNPVESVSDWDG